ncbi:hypothetical protein [Thioclava sp. GXIMD4216]|uniref:Uncharacterized protein n=1 Tax=Thioclava litoralis TaxID=3076557 RepID=A0ABZ1DYX6_9RHOB|nr:hypothetical protein RPE78_10340 [Thioclava sp. FTW29]
MSGLTPADELAQIRSEIMRLRQREAELREAWLTEAEMPRIGQWHKVELVTSRERIFDPRLLPDDIRKNPSYSREKITRTIRLRRKTQADVLAHLPEIAKIDGPPPRKTLFRRIRAS